MVPYRPRGAENARHRLTVPGGENILLARIQFLPIVESQGRTRWEESPVWEGLYYEGRHAPGALVDVDLDVNFEQRPWVRKETEIPDIVVRSLP